MTIATIHERGNGFPDSGDYVPGDDGELYRIKALNGVIHTSGNANYIFADVELASWSDVEDNDVADNIAIVQ